MLKAQTVGRLGGLALNQFVDLSSLEPDYYELSFDLFWSIEFVGPERGHVCAKYCRSLGSVVPKYFFIASTMLLYSRYRVHKTAYS